MIDRYFIDFAGSMVLEDNKLESYGEYWVKDEDVKILESQLKVFKEFIKMVRPYVDLDKMKINLNIIDKIIKDSENG